MCNINTVEQKPIIVEKCLCSINPQPTFLVVDDEPLISKTIGMLLKRSLDCKVLEYNDPVEAFDAFQTQKDSITMVITDYFMPCLSGADLCRKIRALNPDVLLVMVSAYGATDQVRDGAVLAAIDAFVAKPFHLDALLSVVQQLLKAAKDPADRINLFVQHFVEHARGLAQGTLEQKACPVPFVLKFLEKHHFNSQQLDNMNALRTIMAEEENYLGALEIVETLHADQAKRVMAIKRWLNVNRELVKSV